MPHYFFHVRESGELSRDGEGQDLPDLAAARREAVNASRELISERLLHGGAINDREIEIADVQGNVLAVVKSSDVIYREGRFGSFSDDVTKSAPVTNPIPPKPSAE